MRLRAVAAHTFAGGFLIGVRQAGFSAGRAYEPLGFGLDSLRGLDVAPKALGLIERDWPRPPYPVDLLFGNPRCGGFSGLGSNVAGETGRGAGCHQSIDAEQLCRFGARIGARVVVFESVQQILNPKNRGFVDRMAADVLGPCGYKVAHVLVCGQSFGNPQYRKRYFFVAYKEELSFRAEPPMDVPEEMVTVNDAIGDLSGRKTTPKLLSRSGVEYGEDSYTWLTYGDGEGMDLLRHLEPGWTLNHLHRAHGPEWFRRHGFDYGYRVSSNARSDLPFSISTTFRLRGDGPCPTLTGSCHELVHPTLNRTLTVRELCRLAGWPNDATPRGQSPGAQLAKGIIPGAGRYVAEQVRRHVFEKPGRGCDDGSVFDYTKHAPRKTITTYASLRRG